jgi:subtilase family serine protease
LWEFDGYRKANIGTYSSHYDLGSQSVRIRPVGGTDYDNNPGRGEVEAELDTELVLPLAPKANLLVYEPPNTNTGEVELAHEIVSKNEISVLSISWGACEQDHPAGEIAAVHNAFMQAAAQGISMFAASGTTARGTAPAPAPAAGCQPWTTQPRTRT